MQTKFFPKRVFFLSGSRLTVYQWDGVRMLEPLAFGHARDELSNFARYLEESPRIPAYLLVDIVEEEFREESIPHVFGPDRRALVRAKTRRIFRDSRYANSIPLGREAEGRKDDRLLFVAIINPDVLTPWLAQIHRFKIPLAGIYSLPVLSQHLLKHVPVESGHAVVVTMHRAGGLRQSFFSEGKIQMSRLAIVPGLDESRLASYILGEVEKTRRYLNSLRLLSRETPLDIYLINHGAVLKDLKKQAEDTIASRYRFVDVSDVARRVGVHGKLYSPFSDAVFAQLLARVSPRSFYVTAEDTRYFEMHRLRLGLAAASVVLLLGSVGWSGLEFIDGVVAQHEAQTFRQQAGFYRERYHKAKGRLPTVPANGQELKTAVELAGTLRRYRSSPYEMMVLLSQGLDRSPNLKVEKIDWLANGNPEMNPTNPLIVDSPRAATREPAFRSTGSYFQIARIEGRVDPFTGNYRQALEQINRFADFLSEQQDVDAVKRVKMPLNLSPKESISGTAGAGTKNAAATFELDVVLKTHHGES